jgi:hypothetical protein
MLDKVVPASIWSKLSYTRLGTVGQARLAVSAHVNAVCVASLAVTLYQSLAHVQ